MSGSDYTGLSHAERRALNAARLWPLRGLQRVDACPVCGGSQIDLEHEMLVDHLFEAPGVWTMYRCRSCESGYLNPRPSRDSIHLAYASYYTHNSNEGDELLQFAPGWSRRLKQRIFSSYVAWRFASQPLRIVDVVGGLMFLRPIVRRLVDAEMRWIPKSCTGSSLLDIGCGSGRFLWRAARVGWHVIGLEFDPTAARVCRSKGLEVFDGTLEELASTGRRFDVITLSHVIEHVHDPLALLRSARTLLADGGYFWIETPNRLSHGHKYYGTGWAGLHTPHHLQVFSPQALRKLMDEAGFENVRHCSWRPLWRAFGLLAFAPKRSASEAGLIAALRSMWHELPGMISIARREFITLSASK